MVHPTRTDGWTDSFKDKSLDDRQPQHPFKDFISDPRQQVDLSLSVGMCNIMAPRLRECLKEQNRAGFLSTPNPFLWAVGTRSLNGMGVLQIEIRSATAGANSEKT